jgi:hypothetical protein
MCPCYSSNFEKKTETHLSIEPTPNCGVWQIMSPPENATGSKNMDAVDRNCVTFDPYCCWTELCGEEAVEDMAEFLNCMNPTSGRGENLPRACHPSPIGDISEKEEVLATQADKTSKVANVDAAKKPPPGSLTEDDVNQHDAVLNANKRLVQGQMRWIKQVRGPRRSLHNKPDELQRVILCFQKPQLHTAKDGQSSTLVTPRLLVCKDKKNGWYQQATLHEVTRNIASKRSGNPKKGKREGNKKSLLATAPPVTQIFVQRTTSDDEIHQVHPMPCSTIAGAYSDAEPQKSLRQFIEGFKKRLLHELPAGRSYDREYQNFLSYLDSCLTMPFVNDDLIPEAEEADGRKILTNGNRLTRAVILSLWSQLDVHFNTATTTVEGCQSNATKNEE